MKKTVILFSLAFTLIVSAALSDNYFAISKNIEIFTTLYREVNAYYVDDIDASKFIRTGINSMLKSLDPYTNFYSESEVEDYRFQTTGQYGGIGAQISKREGRLVVIDPYEGFAAQKADLRAGDVIMEISGESVEGKNSNDLSKFLKGQPGSNVEMKVKRPGTGDVLTKELVREEILISSVPFFTMLENKIGYIQLSGFKTDSYKEIFKAFKDLEQQGMEKLVLDLRGNPGGLLDMAVKISGMFIPQGSLVVETKGKASKWNATYKTSLAPQDLEIPLAVLINQNSASASEIVSGVMQDYDRAVVVGQKSYGKGLVQTVRPLSYNTQVKVTTAKYYTPSGRCIQKLNYSDKVDGEAQRFDGKTEYKTKNGRSVFDADGVNPDIKVSKVRYADITQALLKGGLLFDFATLYRNSYTEIDEASDFSLSEDEYQKFLNFITDKDYSYETQSEILLSQCLEQAEKEGYHNAIASDLETVIMKLQSDKSNDLEKHKAEVKELLEREIVSRYHFQDGRLEAGFDTDLELLKALEVLNDKQQYQGILKG